MVFPSLQEYSSSLGALKLATGQTAPVIGGCSLRQHFEMGLAVSPPL